MEERHADDGGDFRDSVGPAGVPRRCEQSQQKSGNLASCLLAGGVLFRPLAIRYDVSPGHRGCDTPGSQKAPSAKRCIKTRTRICSTCQRKLVRKHRAPKGALRLDALEIHRVLDDLVRKHRAPKSALRRVAGCPREVVLVQVRKHRTPQISHVIPFFQLCTNSQKSQSFNDPTKNVETTGRELRATFLRNHPRRAPNSALRRQVVEHDDVGFSEVREHRAPKGALRHTECCYCGNSSNPRQKAPSAKRCIKTCGVPRSR